MLAQIIAQKTNTTLPQYIDTPEQILMRHDDARKLHDQLVVICQRHPRFIMGRVTFGILTISKSAHSYQVRVNGDVVFDYQPETRTGYDVTIGYYNKPEIIHVFKNGLWRVLVNDLENEVLKN